jgi:hypothetical protein
MYHHTSDTLNGADSSGLHTGLSHPGQGQTSQELRYDRSKGGAKQTHGLAGVGSAMGNKGEAVNAHDPTFAGQRALDKDVPAGQGAVWEGQRLKTESRRVRRGWM